MAATASSGRRATAPPTPATNPKGVDSDGHRGGYGAGVAWTEEHLCVRPTSLDDGVYLTGTFLGTPTNDSAGANAGGNTCLNSGPTTGHYSQPSMPTIKGMEVWRRRQLHSHSYRLPEPFRDEVVVMVGCGENGKDIALVLIGVAKEHQTLQLSCLHRFLPKVLNLILRLQEHFRWVNLVLGKYFTSILIFASYYVTIGTLIDRPAKLSLDDIKRGWKRPKYNVTATLQVDFGVLVVYVDSDSWIGVACF
ncbi:hypothetical protein OsJ_21260 [Oryza sativa Japonica Group]|uniref:Flavin-containing monooxygenase n=1 Tax=Oryza sativa subsp. japonica TaxID=39947 RepID=A3BBI2_ORYSJ|nr:hypothetical protein OsJ_21260 [Oryza sativa Japonica Group]